MTSVVPVFLFFQQSGSNSGAFSARSNPAAARRNEGIPLERQIRRYPTDMDLLHCVCPADVTLKRCHRVGMKRVAMQRLMSNVPDRITNCQPLLGIERQLSTVRRQRQYRCSRPAADHDRAPPALGTP